MQTNHKVIIVPLKLFKISMEKTFQLQKRYNMPKKVIFHLTSKVNILATSPRLPIHERLQFLVTLLSCDSNVFLVI